jgi:DNA-binding NarL/FixJ family response regulator
MERSTSHGLKVVGPQPGGRSRRARRVSDDERAHVSLVVADAYAAARAGVRAAVEPYGFQVVAEAGDAAAAVEAAERTRPNLCLLAVDLPGGGLDATRRITEKLPETAVVVLGSPSSEDLTDAVEAGASGYLPRTTAPERLPDALNAALDGYVSLPLRLLTRIVERGERGSTRAVALPGMPAVRLTPREQQVLEGMLQDESNVEIAERLGISPVTVRRYASDVIRKTGVKDRAALRALWQQREA